MLSPSFPGWHLIGSFDSDVGSWLLHHGNEAMLLEVPEGLKLADVQAALRDLGSPELRYITASHAHEDHLNAPVWRQLPRTFPAARLLHPAKVHGDRSFYLGGERGWLIKAPKHSPTDVVTVFRGVAMTGDIELGMLESINGEVSERIRRRSMAYLQSFQDRAGYHIHSLVSAHLDDLRIGICWEDLFTISS